MAHVTDITALGAQPSAARIAAVICGDPPRHDEPSRFVLVRLLEHPDSLCWSCEEVPAQWGELDTLDEHRATTYCEPCLMRWRG